MQTMEQGLFELVTNKMIMPDEALMHTMHPDELRRMIDSARR
jgi:Tfp pilus assembly ATPase PilU